MDVFLDQRKLGQAHDKQSLSLLFVEHQLDHVVCTRIDGEDSDLDELLERSEWVGKQLQLFTFDIPHSWTDQKLGFFKV